MADTNYRYAFFKHWGNLTFLAGSVAAAALVDWKLGVAAGIVELLALWVLPDFKGVQRALDAGQDVAKLEAQRRYFLKVLWGINVPKSGTFTVREVEWDRYVPGNTPQRQSFQRMVGILRALREMQKVRPESISARELMRLEELLNRWLELHFQVVNIEDTLRQIDRQALARELAQLEQLAQSGTSDRAAQIVLAERFRTLRRKAESIPRHERRRALWLAQAESIVQHLEEINTSVRTAGLSDAGILLDSTALDNLMGDSVFENAEATAEMRDLFAGGESDLQDPTVWGNLRQQLGTQEPVMPEPVPEPPPAPPRRGRGRTVDQEEEQVIGAGGRGRR